MVVLLQDSSDDRPREASPEEVIREVRAAVSQQHLCSDALRLLDQAHGLVVDLSAAVRSARTQKQTDKAFRALDGALVRYQRRAAILALCLEKKK